MSKLYIDTLNRIAVNSPYDPTPVREINLRAGDSPSFDLHYLDLTVDPKGPFAIRRYQTAAMTMALINEGNIIVASQSTWTEIVPTTTAPTVTRVVSGSATLGEYDRITFASQPGSGFYNILLRGGVVSSQGASSASAKVYPGMTSPLEVSGAFARMIGAPWHCEFSSLVTTDVHGNAVGTGTPFVQEVLTTNLQYLFGWTASLVLTGAGVSDIASVDGDTPELKLAVTLTPSGGAAAGVLLLPVNLFL